MAAIENAGTSFGAASRAREIPLWLRAVVILGAFLLTGGAAIALFHPIMLVSPHDEINGAVHIYAGYLASRNLGLATVLVLAMSLRAKEILSGLLICTAFIQIIDGVIDCFEQRWAIAPGVTVFGIVFLFAAYRLSGYAFWRVEAWRSR
jgi:hypothetical protein